jgi:hypothetical protein
MAKTTFLKRIVKASQERIAVLSATDQAIRNLEKLATEVNEIGRNRTLDLSAFVRTDITPPTIAICTIKFNDKPLEFKVSIENDHISYIFNFCEYPTFERACDDIARTIVRGMNLQSAYTLAGQPSAIIPKRA